MTGVDNLHPLLDAAASISNGNDVDWAELRRRVADDVDTAVLDELQVLDGIARIHRNEWGALEILEPIGHGSFGTVYRAFDRDLHRDIALKVTRSVGPGAAIDPERLVREAQRLARVKHPNVVAVYSAERRGNEVGVAMEWLKGQTLDAIVQAQGPLGAAEAALIGVDVCRAVAAVHAAGLLHGDIKAHNVMREEGGRIVLMDFGASRDLSRPPDSGNDFAGTPLYIAPEVFAGTPRSTASDVYSLGVLLYYLATGRYPVDGDTRSAIDRQHQRTSGRRHLRDVRPDLPDQFVQVVERAIAENPAERFPTAGALEEALLALLGRTVVAVPLRRRGSALLLVASLVVLSAIAAWLTLGGRRNSDPSAAAASQPTVAAATTGGAPAVTDTSAEAATPYSIDAAFYRVDGSGRKRLTAMAPVRPGDRLFLQVKASVPTHVYVVNEDERGERHMLFPLAAFPQKNPLPAGRLHRLPGVRGGDEYYWNVTTVGERDHFVIFVSPTALPAIEKMLAQLPQATEDAPVLDIPVSTNAFNTLRGVGGVVAATAPRGNVPLHEQFPTPLPDSTETTTGTWIRQFTVTSKP